MRLIATLLALGPLAVVPLAPTSATPVVRSAAAVAINPCFSSDNGDPVLDSIELSTTSVDVTEGPAVVTVTVRAHDTGGPGPASGLVRGWVRFTSDSAVVHEASLSPSEATTLVGTLSIGRNEDPGAWSVTSVGLVDRADEPAQRNDANSSWYADAPGVYATDSLAPYDPPSLTVTGTVDRDAPVVSGISVDRTTYDIAGGGEPIHLSVRISDASDIAVSTVDWRKTSTGTALGARFFELTRVSPDDDLYRATVTAGRWAGRHRTTYEFGDLRVVDSAGNSTVVPASTIAEAIGSPLTLLRPVDSTVPRILSTRLSRSRIDLDRHQRVTLTVHVRDTGTGVRRVTDPNVFSDLHLVRGNRHDGVWRGQVVVDPCRFTRPYLLTPRANANDAAGHFDNRRHIGEIAVTGTAVLRPGVRIGAPSAGGAIEISFTRRVVGVSPSSVVVRRDDGSTVAGTLICRARSGARVGCDQGRARSARFTPDDALPPGTWLTLSINPEGSLGVRTPSGAPAYPTQRGGTTPTP